MGMNEIGRLCADELARMPDIGVAILYGSCAAGKMNQASDVDIAVAGAQRLSIAERARIAACLARRVQRDVDVIDLQAISGVLLHQALAHGTPVLVRNKPLYAALMKRMLFNQADVMPYYRRLLAARRTQFFNDHRRSQ